MTLSTDLAAKIQQEAKAAHATIDCKSLDDFAETTLKPLGVKHAHLLIDGGWAMQCTCAVLASMLRSRPETQGKCKESDLQEQFFGRRTFEFTHSPVFAEKDIVFDAGVPACKIEEAKERTKRGAIPYPAEISMSSLAHGIEPERFARSKHLFRDFFTRTLRDKAFVAKDCKHRVDAKEGVYEGTAAEGWALHKRERRHLEADLQIPELIEAAAKRGETDAFVVVGTDGDFFTVLSLLLHQHANDGLFKQARIFLYRPLVSPKRAIPPEVTNMNLLYKYWMNAHGNLLTLCAAHLFTKTDIAPFRKKVLFKGIGDKHIIEGCLDTLSRETRARALLEKSTFLSGVRQLYGRCRDIKGTTARKDYESMEVDADGEDWDDYCKKHAAHFFAAVRYWSRETGPHLDAVWIIKKPFM